VEGRQNLDFLPKLTRRERFAVFGCLTCQIGKLGMEGVQWDLADLASLPHYQLNSGHYIKVIRDKNVMPLLLCNDVVL
jgi:hypothetical protein